MYQFTNKIVTLRNGFKYIILKQLLHKDQTFLLAKNYDARRKRCLPCYVILKVLEDEKGLYFEVEKDPATIYTIMSLKEVLECIKS